MVIIKRTTIITTIHDIIIIIYVTYDTTEDPVPTEDGGRFL